jgi:hypothetical protein
MDVWKRFIVIILICAIAFLAAAFKAANEARQARFNVNVLQRYIEAYKTVEGKQIKSLAELPDFHIISTYDSLSVKAQDLRRGMVSGYIYDMDYLGGGKYVISASPTNLINSRYEFGINERGVLKMNNKGADPTADSREEMESWQEIQPIEQVRTAQLPDYLKD